LVSDAASHQTRDSPRRSLLIVGKGRSGTSFVSKMFASADRVSKLNLGPDYTANFIPRWNFVAITWRSPGWNISLGPKYEIVCEKSQENQNSAENTSRENRCIASLVVWPLVGAQFLTFWDSDSLQWWWNWDKACLRLHISGPERPTCIERKYVLKLAEFMASLTASCCLTLSRYSYIPSELWN